MDSCKKELGSICKQKFDVGAAHTCEIRVMQLTPPHRAYVLISINKYI